MTKQEAIEEMKKGVKITHHYFSSYEWMTIEGNRIRTEDDCLHNMNEFWSYRTDSSWNDGYSLFNQ